MIKKLTKTSLISVALYFVASCTNNLPRVEPGEIILDINAKVLCLNSTASCRSLGLITANSNRDKILRHWPVTNPFDWSKLKNSSDLAKLLLTPADDDYIVTPLTQGRYRLSRHPGSQTAWQVLDAEHHLRYMEEEL